MSRQLSITNCLSISIILLFLTLTLRAEVVANPSTLVTNVFRNITFTISNTPNLTFSKNINFTITLPNGYSAQANLCSSSLSISCSLNQNNNKQIVIIASNTSPYNGTSFDFTVPLRPSYSSLSDTILFNIYSDTPLNLTALASATINPSKLNCFFTKSTDTTLSMFDFIINCTVGSISIPSSDYFGIVFPPFITPLKNTNLSITVQIFNSSYNSFQGIHQLVYYTTSTKTELWGDIINSTILYVQYDTSAPALRNGHTFQIKVFNCFRSYPSNMPINYSFAIFQSTIGFNIRQASDSGIFSFPTIKSNVFSINQLSSETNGTQIVNYELNVSITNPYELLVNQSILSFFDILNISISPTGKQLEFNNNSYIIVDGKIATITNRNTYLLGVDIRNLISLNKSSENFIIKVGNVRNKFNGIQRSKINIEGLDIYNNNTYKVGNNVYLTEINKCGSICKQCSILSTNCTSCAQSLYLLNGTCSACSMTGFFPNNNTLVCQACAPSCQNCSILSTNCTSCAQSLYLLNGTCSACSMTGFFPNNNTLVCQACAPSCQNCSILSTNCTSCAQSLYLLNGTCSACSMTGFFPNNNTLVCQACAPSCQNCSILSTNCTSCAQSLYLLNGTCSACSMTGFFPNNNTLVCQACAPSCQNCSILSTNCTSCAQSLYLLNGTCSACSMTGFFPNNNTLVCQACAPSCQNCSILSTNCTSCAQSLYLLNGTCSACSMTGFFPNNNTLVCQACAPSCQNCSILSTNCTSCAQSLYLLNGTCSACSMTGFFPNNNTLVCQACAPSCQNCSILSTNCTSCAQSLYLLNGTCSACSMTGFFPNNNTLVCQACAPSCQNCSILSTNCTSCAQSLYLLNGTCSACSMTGFFPNNNTLVCQACAPSCQNCSILSTNCTSCAQSLYLLNGTCSACSMTGFFPNNNTLVCQACAPSCQNCSILSTNCTSCAQSLYLLNGTCSACSMTGFFPNNNTLVCQACAPSCQNCSILSTNCTSCAQSLYLLNGTCSACSMTGFFPNNNTLVCQACAPSCQNCSILSTNCTSCAQSLYLLNGTCSACSMTGFFPNNNTLVCQACAPSCQNCSILSTNCTSCAQSLYLLNGTCSACSMTGFFPNNNTLVCQACAPSCQNCSILSTNCTSCAQSLYLLNGTCSACSMTGFFPNNNTLVCQACAPSCQNCSILSTNCTSCAQSLYLLNGTCSACSMTGFFPNNNTLVCQACAPSCQNCSILSTNCTSCAQSLYLLNGTCSACSMTGFFPNNNTLVCQACAPSCQNCSILSTNCTSCAQSLYLLNGTCSACSMTGFFPNNNTLVCQACAPSCQNCSILSTNCTSCAQSLYLLNGTCSACSMTGFFPNNNTLVCQACAPSCQNCSILSTNCTSCAQSLYLLNGTCSACSMTGFFPNNNTLVCQACAPSCQNCSILSTNCTLCSIGYIFQSLQFFSFGSCRIIPICNSSSFLNSSYFCQSCDSTCFTCSQDPSYCTSCNNNLYFYNNGCNALCPISYYPNASSFNCDKCNIQCKSCNLTSSNCLSCSSFYTNISSLPGSCVPILNCSAGTVFSKGKCICSSSCLTCNNTLDNCLSCSSPLLLFQSKCVQNCSIGYFKDSNNTICSTCPNPCIACSSKTVCLLCASTDLTLFKGVCLSECPQSYYKETDSDNASTCKQCSSGCVSCINSTYCSLCNSSLSLESNKTNNITSQYCMSKAEESSSLMLPFPFPFAIAFLALGLVSLISKATIPYTLLPSCLCAFSGVIENISWISLIIFNILTIKNEKLLTVPAIYLISLATLLNILFNSINAYLLKKNLWQDQKFEKNRKQKLSKVGVCKFYTILVISILFSHKFFEILFSNLFLDDSMKFKVKSVLKLSSFNYIKYCSLLTSILAIVSSVFLFNQFPNNRLLYWQSIDVIVMSVFSMVMSIWVTKRSPQHYQNSIGEKSLEILDIQVHHSEEPQIHFQVLRKQSHSDNSQNGDYDIKNYKGSVNITEQNLMVSIIEPKNINVVPMEKDELHQTRITKHRSNQISKNRSNKYRNQSGKSNQSNEQQGKKQRSNRSRNNVFVEQEDPNQKIQHSFTPQQIFTMRIIKKSEELVTQIKKQIRNQIRQSEQRINPNQEQTFSFIMNLQDSQINMLQKKTKQLLLAIRQSILNLASISITPKQFLQYLQANYKEESLKENNNMINISPHTSAMPPLPHKDKRSKSRRSRDSLENRLKVRQTFKSPYVQQFGRYSPQSQANDVEQYSQIPNNIRNPPNFNPLMKPATSQFKTPDSQGYQAGYSVPLASSQKKATPKRQMQYIQGSQAGRESIQMQEGLSGLKNHEQYKLKQQSMSKSPSNPLISLSRLQELHKCDSLYIDQGNQQGEEFQQQESIAKRMNKYGQKQKQFDDIPDENEQKFKAIRRKGNNIKKVVRKQSI